MDITGIVEIIISLLAALITVFLIPYIKSKLSTAQEEKLSRFIEIAITAAEEAARSGLIGKEEKFSYASKFLEMKGYVFDNDILRVLIDSKVWEILNQFRQ